MKKILFGGYLMMYAILVFTSCAKLEADPYPIKRLSLGQHIPVVADSILQINGYGFNSGSEVYLYMADVENADTVKAEFVEFAESYVWVHVPEYMGNHDVYVTVKQEGLIFPLGVVRVEKYAILPKKVTEISIMQEGQGPAATEKYEFVYDQQERLSSIIILNKDHDVAPTQYVDFYYRPGEIIYDGNAFKLNQYGVADSVVGRQSAWFAYMGDMLSRVVYKERFYNTYILSGQVITRIDTVEYSYAGQRVRNKLNIDLFALLMERTELPRIARLLGIVGSRTAWMPTQAADRRSKENYTYEVDDEDYIHKIICRTEETKQTGGMKLSVKTYSISYE